MKGQTYIPMRTNLDLGSWHSNLPILFTQIRDPQWFLLASWHSLISESTEK